MDNSAVLDRTFRDPAGTSVSTSIVQSGFRLEFDVHVTDQITVSGDRDGNATRDAAVPLTVCSMFSIAKLVWRL